MKYTHVFLIMLVTAMLTLSVFGSGCTDTEPEIIETPTATPTQEATETATQTATVESTPEITPTPSGTPQIHTIWINHYTFIPSGGKEVNVGDTVKWRNKEYTHRILVNENGIWEGEQNLGYMRSVNYTFTEPGVYTFYLQPRVDKLWNLTVV